MWLSFVFVARDLTLLGKGLNGSVRFDTSLDESKLISCLDQCYAACFVIIS